MLFSGGFTFNTIAVIGQKAPGKEGGTFVNDFEPYSLNSNGNAGFAADVSTGGEGAFMTQNGKIVQLARSGETEPGPGALGFSGVFGHVFLNDSGDAAVTFSGKPDANPAGTNGYVLRYTKSTGVVTPAEVAGVTKAPGGGHFLGAYIHTALNDNGALVFAGIVPTTQGIHVTGQTYLGEGMGVFQEDKLGHIIDVAMPGDAAPDGRKFDFAENPWINNRGDVAFGAHLAGDPIIDFGIPQSMRVFSAESVYVKDAATGKIRSIAHQGDPAPGGGTFRLAFGPVINDKGQILFAGDLTKAPGTGKSLGVFLNTGSSTVAVARPGQALPGGGHLLSTSFSISNYSLNNAGDVVFNATLDTSHKEGAKVVPDTGMYLWSQGMLSVIARTGTVIPGVGTVKDLGATNTIPFSQTPPVNAGAVLNDRGQVLFQAVTTNGKDALLRADPQPAVAAPHATVAGKTLQQWSAAWWQYVFKVPLANSPLFDKTGANAAVGQSGPVFFLSGTLSLSGGPPAPSTFNRTVTVSSSQYLFFPISNAWVDNLGVSPPLTVAQLRAAAAASVDATTEMHASIDGVAVPDLFSHREVSPVFSYTIPNNNVFEQFGYHFPAQTVSPAVADGYYLMIGPLLPGTHVINFGASAGSSTLDVTYRVNVVP